MRRCALCLIWACFLLGLLSPGISPGNTLGTGPEESANLKSQIENSPASSPVSATQPAGKPLNWKDVFQPGDRILLVGDDITQQMLYDRALMTALLALRPDKQLRYFNGGKEGATARTLRADIDDLLTLTRPTVVFVLLGLNDGRDPEAISDPPGSYEKNLTELATKIRLHTGVRQVVLLSPVAIQPGLNPELDAIEYNKMLAQLAERTRRVAQAVHTGYIDVFAPTYALFDAASKTTGEALTLGGRLPNDLGHVLLASIILRGLGMTSAELEPVAWAPLPPRKMARIRPVLAIELKAPSLEASQPCRDLFEAMLPYNESFFRAWRVSGTRPSAPKREVALAAADQAWQRVDNLARQLYAGK